MWSLLSLLGLLLLTDSGPRVHADPQVPCFFIFGDSLSDSGNNNELQTLAKANFLPYGIDFPGGPTGRFTNGRTTVDLIGDHLGLNSYIPPFSNVSGQEILKGVNYASGSAGILSETGSYVTLYKYGARRVVLFGLGPLGCLPLFRSTGKCEDRINDAIQLFNSRLKSLVDDLNQDYPDAQFIFVNTFSIVSPNLSALGLSVLDVPCCGVGDMYCLPFSVPCKNRNSYAYWDNAHPTEAANKVLASRAHRAQDPNDTYPMDIRSLVRSLNNSAVIIRPVCYGELIATCLMLSVVFIL
ncbi:hypothetical protein Ancab_034008 [Ancistrocladus abbreviatus]